MEADRWAEACTLARTFQQERVAYTFTQDERRVLEPFFSNIHRKVFFVQRLPEPYLASLLAMYSRLKNPRGIRGHFVDNMLPKILTELVPSETASPLEVFLKHAPDPEFWRTIGTSINIRNFLGKWLDGFGHNSIARTTAVTFCVEDASVLAVKSIEWTRPASGYIELSTRYVDVSGKGQYPIAEQIGLWDASVGRSAAEMQHRSMAMYRRLMGNAVDGPFPSFLRQQYGQQMPAEDLKAAVLGETCDVLGNLLPCSTLTAVGVTTSAEAFPEILKHLRLDATPETIVLADAIAEEARAVGLANFIRHDVPTPWEVANWTYLSPCTTLQEQRFFLDPESSILNRLRAMADGASTDPISRFLDVPRTGFDKLPSDFETSGMLMKSSMSFRSWRDTHRQGFCTHKRSRVVPGSFYVYPKPAPAVLAETFQYIHEVNEQLSRRFRHAQVPEALQEYPMAMGTRINYVLGANLREWEFCIWQRTGRGVNDEVRGEFLAADRELCQALSWWKALGRADRTPHYAFARGQTAIILSE